jgi:hypothetical protein
MDKLKNLISGNDVALWALALVCATVLASLKVADVKMVEYIIFAILGRGVTALVPNKEKTNA